MDTVFAGGVHGGLTGGVLITGGGVGVVIIVGGVTTKGGGVTTQTGELTLLF